MAATKGRSLTGWCFLLISILFTVFFSSNLQAGIFHKDLIVRFHEPQNTKALAILSALKGTDGLQAKLSVLNSEEGVVLLRFSSAEEAERARASLAQSESVGSLAPNLFYRPAMQFRLREVDVVSESESRFLALPFALLATGSSDVSDDAVTITIPDVAVPPVQKLGDDPLLSKDWAMENVRLTKVLDKKATSSVIAAVIDTGVDYNHEDLIAGMWRKEGNDREVGFDFVHNNAKPFDVRRFDVEGCLKDAECRTGIDTSKYLVNPGHGTHCAGHVGAVSNNALGIRGLGAGVGVMALKFFYDYGEEYAGRGDDAAAIQAIDYAIKHGVKVINASWGGRTKRDEGESSELKQAFIRAQKAGVLIVVAAGNDGIDQDSVEDPCFPAAYDLDNLIVVAATDKDDKLADFSNYGAKSVHIGAPGVRILSTVVGGQYSDVTARFKTANGKEMELPWDGTSMAAPIVAGAVGLVWSHFPKEDYHQIRDRILKTARRVTDLEGKVATAGILNVEAALNP